LIIGFSIELVFFCLARRELEQIFLDLKPVW
jgi:hypothetical protein